MRTGVTDTPVSQLIYENACLCTRKPSPPPPVAQIEQQRGNQKTDAEHDLCKPGKAHQFFPVIAFLLGQKRLGQGLTFSLRKQNTGNDQEN